MSNVDKVAGDVLSDLKDAGLKESTARSESTNMNNIAEQWLKDITKKFAEDIGPVFRELGGMRSNQNSLKENLTKIFVDGLQKH